MRLLTLLRLVAATAFGPAAQSLSGRWSAVHDSTNGESPIGPDAGQQRSPERPTWACQQSFSPWCRRPAGRT
jgi:hypothetical protein